MCAYMGGTPLLWFITDPSRPLSCTSLLVFSFLSQNEAERLTRLCFPQMSQSNMYKLAHLLNLTIAALIACEPDTEKRGRMALEAMDGNRLRMFTDKEVRRFAVSGDEGKAIRTSIVAAFIYTINKNEYLSVSGGADKISYDRLIQLCAVR